MGIKVGKMTAWKFQDSNQYSIYFRSKKCSFFGKFDVICFLEKPVLRFALLPYYRRYISYRCRKTSFLWRQLTGLDLPSIFSFLDDALEHKLHLNHILLIFKNYFYKARGNKNLNFNIDTNYLTKIRDLEANLKDNVKYNKKWTVISNML